VFLALVLTEELAPSNDIMDGVQQLLERLPLVDDTDSARLDALGEADLVRYAGEHHHGRPCRRQRRDGGKARTPTRTEVEVEENDVGPFTGHGIDDCIYLEGSTASHVNPGATERQSEALRQQGVVVDDHHPHRARRSPADVPRDHAASARFFEMDEAVP
jgi:hypothetical protein